MLTSTIYNVANAQTFKVCVYSECESDLPIKERSAPLGGYTVNFHPQGSQMTLAGNCVTFECPAIPDNGQIIYHQILVNGPNQYSAQKTINNYACIENEGNDYTISFYDMPEFQADFDHWNGDFFHVGSGAGNFASTPTSPLSACLDGNACASFDLTGPTELVIDQINRDFPPYCYKLQITPVNSGGVYTGTPIERYGLFDVQDDLCGPNSNYGIDISNDLSGLNLQLDQVYLLQIAPYVCCGNTNADAATDAPTFYWSTMGSSSIPNNGVYIEFETVVNVDADFDWSVRPNGPLDVNNNGEIDNSECGQTETLGANSVGIYPTLIQGNSNSTSSTIHIYEIDCTSGSRLSLLRSASYGNGQFPQAIDFNLLSDGTGTPAQCNGCFYFQNPSNTSGKCFEAVLTSSNDCVSSEITGCFTIQDNCPGCLTIPNSDASLSAYTSSETLIIRYDGGEFFEGGSLEIVSSLGQILQRQEVQSREGNLLTPHGTYTGLATVILRNSNSEIVATEKIVIF